MPFTSLKISVPFLSQTMTSITALFTNVPLDETINILVAKVFANDSFNQIYDFQLEKDQFARFLEIATINQLF